MEKQWVEVNYWAVFDEYDEDKELFRGSKTAYKKWAKKNHGIVSHVIAEYK